MKLLLLCARCGNDQRVSYVEMSDDNVLHSTCAQGHETKAAVQAPRFDLLFQSGGLALVDGYTREAVTSFAVSLERFYEYWVQVAFFDDGRNGDAVSEFWKPLNKQSERELGAFLCIYFERLGAPAPTLLNKWIEFRNRVIHKGYWPTASEAYEYGTAVLHHIARLLADLRTRFAQGVLLHGAYQVGAAHRAKGSNATVGYASFFDRACAEVPDVAPLEEHLAHLKRHRNIFQS